VEVDFRPAHYIVYSLMTQDNSIDGHRAKVSIDGRCENAPIGSPSEERAGWAELAAARRWTLWTRLLFAQPTSETTAVNLLWEFGRKLRHEMSGTALLIGIHNDTDCLHAHSLIFIPRRFADPFHPPGISTTGSPWMPWLQARWRFGEVWARPYDSSFLYLYQGKQHSGAGCYLARDPGAVISIGTAPPAVYR